MVRRDGTRGGRRHGSSGKTRRGGRELERERVAEIQRARMLDAMAELACELSPERVTVAHVVARAGVSRRTFYELFADREACFAAAFEQTIARAASVVAPAYRESSDWVDGIRAGLTEMLVLFDAEPSVALLCVVGSLAAGPRALARRAELVNLLVGVVDRGRRELGPRATGGSGVRSQAASRLTAEGAVGAVLAVLHARLTDECPKPLIPLRGELMSMLVLPYLGSEAAARELKRPVPRSRRPASGREDPLRGLQMRLTYRTMRVLVAIETGSGLSNREVSRVAEVADQGQISKLLQRLERLELIHNDGLGSTRGEANAWVLTPRGADVVRAIQARTGGGEGWDR